MKKKLISWELTKAAIISPLLYLLQFAWDCAVQIKFIIQIKNYLCTQDQKIPNSMKSNALNVETVNGGIHTSLSYWIWHFDFYLQTRLLCELKIGWKTDEKERTGEKKKRNEWIIDIQWEESHSMIAIGSVGVNRKKESSKCQGIENGSIEIGLLSWHFELCEQWNCPISNASFFVSIVVNAKK